MTQMAVGRAWEPTDNVNQKKLNDIQKDNINI
jgi:hypothetical protein